MAKAKKPIALLTSCSVSRTMEPTARIEDSPNHKTMKELGDWWVKKMQDPKAETFTPGEIYSGTGFTAIAEMAQDIGHDNVFIVTGGAGLSRFTDPIVPYDFTGDKKADHNAHQKVQNEKFVPHVWWQIINRQLNGSAHPIKDLLDEYEIIVGALPKMFTKYIMSDLEVCPPLDRDTRIFIPMTRSMYGGVPAIIRGAYVPYTPEYLGDVMYSRGDKAQRVVQKFLRTCSASKASAVDVAASMVDDAASSEPDKQDEVDYEAMFKDQPSILEADDVHMAAFKAKSYGYKIGGNMRFAGAWRSAKGTIKVVTKGSEEFIEEGANILKDLMTKSERVSDDEVILKRLGMFVVTAKSIDPHLVFTAKEVVSWAGQMYEDDLRGMDNTNKISYLMGYNTGYLGLEEVKAGARKGFRII